MFHLKGYSPVICSYNVLLHRWRREFLKLFDLIYFYVHYVLAWERERMLHGLICSCMWFILTGEMNSSCMMSLLGKGAVIT